MQSFFTTVFGSKTHVLSFGNGKTPFVLLHGWGGDANTFVPLVQELQKKYRKYTFIIPDLPGFGQSTMPEQKQGWQSYDYAKWLDAFLKDQDIPTNSPLLGHSNGARTLVRFTQQNQNSKHPIILMGSPGIIWPLTKQQKITKTLAKTLKPLKAITPKPIQQFIIAKVLRAHDSANAGAMKPTLNKILSEPDLREDLTTIENKTLLLWGAQDSYTPLKSAHIYADAIPNNKLVVLPVARHAIHHTHTRHVANSIKQFLG